jgi:ribosomal protein L16 Arg81 hydroxylase
MDQKVLKKAFDDLDSFMRCFKQKCAKEQQRKKDLLMSKKPQTEKTFKSLNENSKENKKLQTCKITKCKDEFANHAKSIVPHYKQECTVLKAASSCEKAKKLEKLRLEQSNYAKIIKIIDAR